MYGYVTKCIDTLEITVQNNNREVGIDQEPVTV